MPDESNGAVTIVKTKKPKELETVPVKKKKTGAVLFSIVIVLAMAGFGYWAYSKYFAPGNLINKSIVDTKQEQVLSALASSMKYIRGGSFTMGTNDPKRNLDGPEHPVTVKPFLLDAYELTQAEWKTIMKDNRYTDTSLSLFPADSISWEDAKACIAQLNKLLSAMKAQGKTFPFKQFRLPADAEWEFAALNTAATEEQTALNTVSWNVTNSNKKRTRWVPGRRMLMASTICWAMCMSGVKIGMARTCNHRPCREKCCGAAIMRMISFCSCQSTQCRSNEQKK